MSEHLRPFNLNYMPGVIFGNFSLTKTGDLDILIRALTIMRQFLPPTKDNLTPEIIALRETLNMFLPSHLPPDGLADFEADYQLDVNVGMHRKARAALSPQSPETRSCDGTDVK